MSKTPPEVLTKLKELYAQGLCSREIAPIVGKSQKAVQKISLKYNIPRLPQGGPKGIRNGSWNGGTLIDKDGYVLVLVPNHPFGNSGGYVRQHRLVMEDKLKRWLLPTEVVHHKDGNKKNNSIENLELFSKNSEHLKVELTGKCPKWSENGILRIKESKKAWWRARRERANRSLW